MIRIGLLSLGAPLFKFDISQKYLENTELLIHNLGDISIGPDKIILDKMALDSAIETIVSSQVDMVIVQLGTFTPGEFLAEIIQKLRNTPIFAWGFNDPIVKDFPTIPLNSLTTLTMFTSYMKKMNCNFSYCYEDFNNKILPSQLLNMIKAIRVKKSLQKAKYAIVGSRVPGFYLNSIDELNLRKVLGIEVVYYSLAEWIESAKNIDEELIKTEYYNKFHGYKLPVSDEVAKNNIRLEIAMNNYIEQEGITGVAVKCWPEVQSLIDCSVCMILSDLIDQGIMASCEADLPGLVMMDILHKLTKKPVFFADIVAKTKNNYLKAWHCGVGPRSLAADDNQFFYIEQATMRKGIGLAHQYDMKTGAVTICQLNEDNGEYHLFWETGISKDKDRELLGVQTDIALNHPFDIALNTIIENGFGQHFAIVHEDVQLQISEFCKWTKINEVSCLSNNQ